ncbi:MAG: SgcJ/EcaC family oxidoreductase [Burkholderiales bacterium]|nr:SgcJ/EcaC family oxidoreductase [Burkholderiales bacterium]MBI3729172.1 SgcJ/EcaC family oxidoreductase [Burkholderiales bacterium]
MHNEGTEQASAAATTIRSNIRLWQEATAAGDVDKLLDLMDEEVVFLVAGNPPMKGREQFAQNLRNILQTHHIAFSSQIQEIVVQADLAYTWSYLQVEIIPKHAGPQMRRAGNVLSIWRLQADGKWRICRDANLLTLETQPEPGA